MVEEAGMTGHSSYVTDLVFVCEEHAGRSRSDTRLFDGYPFVVADLSAVSGEIVPQRFGCSSCAESSSIYILPLCQMVLVIRFNFILFCIDFYC